MGEQRVAVPLAARDVEHLATGDERRDAVVAMPVLVPDLAGRTGDESSPVNLSSSVIVAILRGQQASLGEDDGARGAQARLEAGADHAAEFADGQEVLCCSRPRRRTASGQVAG